MRLVEATDQAPANERLDLGAVVVRGRQDLIAELKTDGADAVPKPMTRTKEHAAARVVEREWKIGRRPPNVDAEWKRRPSAQPGRHRRRTSESVRFASGRP